MPALRQRPPMAARRPGWLPDRLVAVREEAEAGLRLPLRGVASGAGVVRGLFPVEPSGVSTEPIRAAARAYLETLDEAQRREGTFPITSDAWRRWSNIHPFLMRHGVLLETMSDAQRAAALELVESALSESGYKTVRDVMRLNDRLLEVSGSAEEYGEWLYWMSIFGEPSSDGPFGFQFDGHHAIVNAFVLGDQLVATPMFLGSEPVFAEEGRHAGTRVFAAEEAKALELARSLSTGQLGVACIAAETPGEIFTAAYRDNADLDLEGIRFDALSASQRDLLGELVAIHLDRIRPGHAEVRMAEARTHLPETRFAWMGGTGADAVFYYRVHSPVLLIEFDHLPGVAFDNDEPTRNHIHTVVRTPNGNDYGADLLRQHHEQAHVATTR